MPSFPSLVLTLRNAFLAAGTALVFATAPAVAQVTALPTSQAGPAAAAGEHISNPYGLDALGAQGEDLTAKQEARYTELHRQLYGF